MPDSKITALTSTGTGTDPAVDPLVIVDVSDTTMAATGTTKKVTLNQLLACSPTATLASATITGDLTVDTSTLKVDSANNRVGIGTASPITTFQVQDATLTGASQIRELLIKANSNNVNNSLNSLIGLTFNSSAVAYTAGSLERTSGVYGINLDNAAFGRRMGLVFYTSEQDLVATEKYRIDNSGIATWSNVGGVAGTAMTLNATGLLVGTTNNFASSRLCVQGTAGTSTPDVTIGIPVNASGNTNLAIGRSASTNGYIFLDAYKAGVGGTELVLNSVNGGSVLVGLSTVVPTGGCLQLKSGITFPATQVASSDVNTLDDYKEAAFTPTIVGATTAGTGTYTTQNGRYTKIGNLVTFQVFIDWTAHTGTGNMRIGNLPFTNGSNFWAGSIGYANGIALTAGYVMTGYVESGQSFVTLQQYPTGGGGTTGIPMDTAGAIMFSGSYTV